MWQALLDWLTKEWFGITSTVVSLAIGYALYLKGKREKLPSWYHITTVFMRNSTGMIPGLKIHFAGHGDDILDFAVSRLVLWNRGQETIRKEDFPASEPLRIETKAGVTILSAKLIHQTVAANGFKCSVKDKAVVPITFEYLDFNQCAVLEICHTGTESKSLALFGIVKGAPYNGRFKRIVGSHLHAFTKNSRRRFQSLRYLTLICGITLVAIFVAMHLTTISLQASAKKGKSQLLERLVELAEDPNREARSLERIEKAFNEIFPPVNLRLPYIFFAVVILFACVAATWQSYLFRRVIPREAEKFIDGSL